MQAEKCIVNSAACLQAHKTLAFRNSQEKVCELKIDFGIKSLLILQAYKFVISCLIDHLPKQRN